MKDLANRAMEFIVILFIVGFVGYFIMFNKPIKNKLPWRTQGNYFTIEWEVPENTVRYRGHWSTDSLSLINHPFTCRQFKIPAPLKTESKQRYVIQYMPEKEFAYDFYYRVFAYDVDGNCVNIEFLNYE